VKIDARSVTPFNFEGLEIRDYTGDRSCASSVAEITVPAGTRHRRAWSKRSDKFYFGLQGTLAFRVEDQTVRLAAGDLCVVRKGEKFSYQNENDEPARILLVHTPSFDLEQEVFEEEPGSRSE
jgi:mannose-6-phosphate isomerase-like protein (cupin superfamily)